jgi:antitoxin component of MazEF toxin-antitoxin module
MDAGRNTVAEFCFSKTLPSWMTLPTRTWLDLYLHFVYTHPGEVVMLRTRTTVSMWGNSQALRIPAEMTRRLGLRANDEVVLELREDVLTVSKPETPREGTIEYLFKDYAGESFKTELMNPLEPVGEEKW